MGIFGGKKPEKEAEELFLSGDYDALLDLIFRKAVQSGKMKKDIAVYYLNKIISARESARAYYLLSLLMIPDSNGLKYAIKARDMEPGNKDYVDNLAMYYSEGKKDNDAAMKVYEKYWEDSSDIETGISLAHDYIRHKEPEKARSILQKVLSLDHENKKAVRLMKKLDKQ